MSLFTECLEASQVDSLLHGSLTPEEYEAAQNHLEQCETCRARIESTIGPQQWWNDVQSVLSSDAIHVAASLRDTDGFRIGELDADVSPGETRLRGARLRENVLDLLGPTDDPNMLGRIGPYEITGLLGQGGMGAVFKGFDRSLNRFVAIKMLLPHLAASGAARKRFAREGQAVAAVVDDHVMAIHCVDEWQGVPYLVMTYSRGVSLQKRLSDHGPLEVREILRIGMQTAKGLAAAHAQGIVHRDIKPANIFLDQNVERVQLMDFGLARAVDDASLTRTGVLAGTPQYMSPEQARAETVDHRSDLFSLGGVMYAMCTGHAPFRAESSYGVLRLITDRDPRPIREINPDVPEWLCSIIAKLLAKQASERFQSAKEVSQRLEDSLAHVQQPATVPLPEAVAALATVKSRRPPIGKLIAAAAFAFALLCAGVFIVLELNKGTLTIQSDSDDVRVRITHADKVIDELKVSKSGQSVRVAAGVYKVEIIGESDELRVDNGQVTLHQAGTELVRIIHNEHSPRKDEDGAQTRKPPSPEKRTVQLDEVNWLDLDIEPEQTDNASKLLNTWEEVQDRVAKIVKEREAIANAEVDFKLDSDGEHISIRRYHVWLNGLQRRADCRGVSSDATEDYTHIVTPSFIWYDDHLDKSKSQLDRRDSKDPVGWGTLGCIVDVRKVGLINWSIESIDRYEFDHDLLPKDVTETVVETRDNEGAPITVVKHHRKTTGGIERWTEYWLSPAHGNYPIYIASSWTEPGNQKLKNVISQRTQWEFIDGIWFPRSVKHHYLSEHRKLDVTNTFRLIGARFNVLPFPNVFDPSTGNAGESITNWREDLQSKVVSELPENWTDFQALLPKTGTTLVMFSDQPEIRAQMSPIAKRVAQEASVQFIAIQPISSRTVNPLANYFPSTHYLLVKDRQVMDTRYGVLTEEKLQEFVAGATDWLTPRSTGVEENSLVRIDCYIFPEAGNIGNQSGDAYPITAAVVAVHEDQALLLGPNDVGNYIEKGYACVAIVRDADGKQKHLPLKVLLNEPVKLLGRNGEPHRFQASVRVTHSDGTASELPITSILPDYELMPQPREKYDVASAIYRIQGVQGLKPVKLAALGAAISVGERVLSGSFSQEPIVPAVFGFNSPMQWQAQTVVDIDGVTGGNMHGPETFNVLCPSLPAPSGYTFDERGRLIGKRLGGNPTYEDMRHPVYKSHATHSILRAALNKIDDAGLKAASVRTLEESIAIPSKDPLIDHNR